MNFLEKIIDWFKPKEIEMFKRMEKLFYYVEFCNLSKLERVHVSEIKHDLVAEVAEVYFQSNLGQVQIKLIRQINGVYSMSYANYVGTKVFELTTTKHYVDVKPMLGDELSARDVDLAIYELEQYLYNNLGDVEVLLEKHAKLVNENRKKHEEQMKLLETVE